MPSPFADHPAPRTRIRAALINAFWIGVFMFATATVFFLLLGAPAPWATLVSTVVFGAVAVLFVIRLVIERRYRDVLRADPRLRKARERRGY
jgi:membrane protein implicated in regulation of membrane protease activity